MTTSGYKSMLLIDMGFGKIERSGQFMDHIDGSICSLSNKSVDLIPNDISKKRKTRCCKVLNKGEIIKCFSVKEEDAARLLNVSKSKLKRIKSDMGINRWPYRRIESFARDLEKIKQKIDSITHNKDYEFDAQKSICTEGAMSLRPSITDLRMEESILEGSIKLINYIPNIIIRHKNESIKEIARKIQRVSISNLLDL